MRFLFFSFFLVCLFSFAKPTNQAIQLARTFNLGEVFKDFTVLSDQLVANLVDEKLLLSFSSAEKKTHQDYQKLLKKYYPSYRDVTLMFIKKHKAQINEILALELSHFSREELLSLQLETKLIKDNEILKNLPILVAKIAKKSLEQIAPIFNIFIADYVNVATKVFDTKLAKFKTPSPSDKKQVKEYVDSFLFKESFDEFVKERQKQVQFFFPLNYNLMRGILLETISQTYSDAQVKVLIKTYSKVSQLFKEKKRDETLQNVVKEKLTKLFTKYLSLLEPLNQQFLQEPLVRKLPKEQ